MEGASTQPINPFPGPYSTNDLETFLANPSLPLINFYTPSITLSLTPTHSPSFRTPHTTSFPSPKPSHPPALFPKPSFLILPSFLSLPTSSLHAFSRFLSLLSPLSLFSYLLPPRFLTASQPLAEVLSGFKEGDLNLT